MIQWHGVAQTVYLSLSPLRDITPRKVVILKRWFNSHLFYIFALAFCI